MRYPGAFQFLTLAMAFCYLIGVSIRDNARRRSGIQARLEADLFFETVNFQKLEVFKSLCKNLYLDDLLVQS
jgi:hypothetical protein